MYKDIVHKVECAVQRVHVVHSFPTSSADKTYRCTLHWCCTYIRAIWITKQDLDIYLLIDIMGTEIGIKFQNKMLCVYVS